MGDDDLGGLFEDLEQQAMGMHLAERDAELADRARGEYASVSFASRVHASVGKQVALSLRGGDLVEGVLTQAGADWCIVLGSGGLPWLVRLDAVVGATGMSSRAVPEPVRPAVARLGFGAALHRLAGEAPEVLLHLDGGPTLRVRVLRIGADFVEAERTGTGGTAATGRPVLVPLAALQVVRPG
jgi:hypothetical protein